MAELCSVTESAAWGEGRGVRRAVWTLYLVPKGRSGLVGQDQGRRGGVDWLSPGPWGAKGGVFADLTFSVVDESPLKTQQYSLKYVCKSVHVPGVAC